MNGTAHYSCKFFEPYEHGSGKAPLADLLLNDPLHSKLLTRPERELVFAWIDSNGIYYGTWDSTSSGPILTALDDAKRELVESMRAPENGCARCHGDSARFENDWINLANPRSSRVLRAPLAKSSDGLALCRDRLFDQSFLRLGVMSDGRYEHAVKELRMFPTQEWREWDESGDPVCVFESTDSPVYRKMLDIVERARAKALARPRIDMPNACESPGGILEGRSRQIVPLSLPKTEIAFTAETTADGAVRLSWERSARTIGLVFELRRFVENGSDADSGELLTRTERFEYVDVDPLLGVARYELTPISDPTQTCAAYWASAEARNDMRYRIERGKPIVRNATIEKQSAPRAPVDSRAESGIEQIALSWRETSESLENPTRYRIYRSVGCASDGETELTSAPIYGTTFVDRTPPIGDDCVYRIVAVSRRGLESSPTFCSARATAAPKETLFSAPYVDSLAATTNGEAQTAAPRSLGTPNPGEGGVAIKAGEYLAYPNRPEYNAERRFTLELVVRFDAPGEMPVVVSFGQWNRSGWFLQRFNGKWRFHFGGFDCDSTVETPVGRQLRIVATFDGERLRLYQDGALVGERACSKAAPPWSGELFVGQYSADPSAPYQFVGTIGNLKILNYVRSE